MIPKRLASALAVASAISCFQSTTYAQFPGIPEAGGPAASPEKAAPKPRARWQKPLKLPDQYRSKDKDNDGQIGMYEWDKRDYATFRKLDLNHDGFLTAEELVRGVSSKSAKPSTAVAVAASPSRPALPTAPAGTSPGSESAAGPPAVTDTGDATAEKAAPPAGDGAATATAASTAGRSEAERQWEIIDKDKDGKVTEAEWGRSYLARPKFRDAGIAVTFPLGKDEFLQLYSQLPAAGK